MRAFWLVFAALVVLSACKNNDDDAPDTPTGPTRAGRMFGIWTYPAADDNWFAAAQFTVAEKADWLLVTATWSDLDSAGVLRMTNVRNLGLWLVSVNRPITVVFDNDRPADLDTLDYNHPVMIARMQKLLDSLHAALGTAQVHALFLGQEIGDFLGTDAAKWAQYKAFMQAAATRAQALWGSTVRVGTVGNFYHLLDATRGPLYRDVFTVCDVYATSYYPINADYTMAAPTRVQADFDLLAGGFTGKPIYILGAGYSSAPVCNSSDSLQAAFIQHLYTAWDAHSAAIPAVGFTLLHDANPADIDTLIVRNNLTGNPNEARIRGFFGNLGLRTRAGSGSDKPAMATLRTERDRRGW